MDDTRTLANLYKKITEQAPLIHHMTNVVTVNDCANITLAAGARPVMADSPEEVEEMVRHASALVLNIGTVHSSLVSAMIQAGKEANRLGVPVILDPVGVGATTYRRKVVEQLLKRVHLSVICGNMSEIKTLVGETTNSSGVDAGDTMDEAPRVAYLLAKRLNTVIAVTGEEDIVTDGNSVLQIKGGHPLLARVSGTGCMTTSLIGSFAGVSDSLMEAAVSGIQLMGIAGERAYASLPSSHNIGTFKTRLFDSVCAIVNMGIIDNEKRVSTLEAAP